MPGKKPGPGGPPRPPLPPPMIPADQWAMPVSYAVDGPMVSLRQYVSNAPPAVPISQLRPDQWKAITIKRIELQPKFEIAEIGRPVLDKAGALAEIQKRSAMGRALIDIEQRIIRNAVEVAAQSGATGSGSEGAPEHSK